MSMALHADLLILAGAVDIVLLSQQIAGPESTPVREIKGKPDNSYKEQTSKQNKH